MASKQKNIVYGNKTETAFFLCLSLFSFQLILILCGVFFIFFVSFLSGGTAEANDVRVLILDGEFNRIPDNREKIVLLDKTAGKLLVGEKPYDGKIEVWEGGKSLYIIDKVNIENYVKGVVEAETGKDWDIEALKAQAVLSRTYAVNRQLHSGQMKYDLTSSVLDQVYGGEDGYGQQISNAVDLTKGQILVYNGKPIEAFFHSTSCGETEDPFEVFGKHIPYLKPVKVKCDLSPYNEWARRFPPDKLEKALKAGGIDAGKISDIEVKSHTCTGRAKELIISGSKGEFTLNAVDMRKYMGWKDLPSTDFTSQFSNGYWNVKGDGYGHGVGLCQWSALEMARQGMKYTDILSYFYPGTKLVVWK
ncbi:MAG: SpoIID/LytB domain-containing protein [Nitrospiraceae bacterium]|nr:SpoIID/LytB domain-containing protein [Nitrospiraceae bacterium]